MSQKWIKSELNDWVGQLTEKNKSELANSRSELDPKKSELDPFLDRVNIFEKWVGQLKTRGAHGPAVDLYYMNITYVRVCVTF